jgi:hypothetical protein
MQPTAAPTSSFNIQNLGNPGTVLFDAPVDMSRMLYMLYQDIELQINRADLKSQITLSTATVLAALAVNFGPGVTARLGGLSVLEIFAVIFYSLCALSLFSAIGFAVAATYPRSFRHRSPAETSLYFSADLIRLSPEEYVTRFCSQTNQDLKERILKQVHIKAKVLEAKLLFVRRGLRTLVAAIFWWALAHLVLFFAYGTLVK